MSSRMEREVLIFPHSLQLGDADAKAAAEVSVCALGNCQGKSEIARGPLRVGWQCRTAKTMGTQAEKMMHNPELSHFVLKLQYTASPSLFLELMLFTGVSCMYKKMHKSMKRIGRRLKCAGCK